MLAEARLKKELQLKLDFENTLIYWRGPAPFYFIQVPEVQSLEIKKVASQLSYGWGVIPVAAKIRATDFTTALIPKNGSYLLPIKNVVRLGENLNLDEKIAVTLILEG